MKKTASIFLLTLSTFSFAGGPDHMTHDNFTGFNLAAGIGVSGIFVDENIDVAGLGNFNHNHRGNLDFATRASAGYDYVMHHCYLLGADIHYQYNNASVTSGFVSTAFTGKTTLKNMYGISIKLGYLTTDNMLWYVDAGPEWLDYKHNYELNSNAYKTSKIITTGKIGIGAEQALTANWHVSETADYAFGKNITNNKLGTSGANVKHKPSVLSALANIIYRF